MLMNPKWWIASDLRFKPERYRTQRASNRSPEEMLTEIRRDVTLPASRAHEIVDAAVALFRARQEARNGHAV